MRWFLEFVLSDVFIIEKLNGDGEFRTKDFVSRIKELTKNKNESYVDKLSRENPKYVKERADIFISHSWAYNFKDFIAAIQFMIRDAPLEDDMFMWLDAIVINQHKSESREHDPDLWIATLPKTINDIGRMATIMVPFDFPYNLTQTWCLWELYSATLNKETQIDMIILPDQLDSFRLSVREDLLGVMNTFGNINISSSEATTEQELKTIIEAAYQEIGGIDTINENIISAIRDWLSEVAIEIIDDLELKISNGEEVDLEELGYLCNSEAELLNVQSHLEQQEFYIRRALELFIQLNGEDDPDVAVGLNNLALLLQDQGNFTEAEQLFQQAIDIDRKAFGDHHPDVAGGLNNLAFLYQDEKRYNEAEPLFLESIEIFKNHLGHDHADVATAYNNLASLYKDKGDYEKSSQYYQISLDIFRKELGDDHPYTAISEQHLKDVKEKQQEQQ